MKQILTGYFLFFLLACQENEDSNLHLASQSDSFSPEEKQALFPNELFIALVDKKNESDLQNIIDKNGHYLFEQNDEGDTALAVAIKFYNLEGALFIAKQLSPEHYLHQNHQGEGYIYLASQKGSVKLIKLLADRFYESDESWWDYTTTDLDMKTNSGERALHVAKNYLVAEALKHEYWRGFGAVPWRMFQFLQNNEDQTFLHTAVRDQNSDLLRWGVEKNCVSKAEWGEKGFFGRGLSYAWRGIQSYGEDIDMDWDNIINTQDNEGNTAINFSAKNMFLEGNYILSSCQWIDWFLEDDEGNIPLQSFLLSLDSLKPKQNEDVRNAFFLIIESKSKLTVYSIQDHINFVNSIGESSLHIAARLADPFFYDSLKKQGGNVEQENHQKQSPKRIFELRRKQLEQPGV